MPPIRAVCFDLDETLLDDNASYRLSLSQVFDDLVALQPALASAGLPAAYGAISDAHWGAAEGRVVRSPSGALDGAAIRLELWRLALVQCGFGSEELALAALDAYARRRRESYRLFDDVLPVLVALRKHCKLAVITNGPADTQLEKLQVTGAMPYFDAVVASGDAGCAKPDGAIFGLALQRLGVSAAEALHVGDSLSNDVAGARAAGLRSVWLNRGSAVREPHHAEPHHEIASLSELEACLGLE